MEQEVFDKYVKAGRIASEVREASRQIVKPGAKILDIAEQIEKMIKDKGAGIAFPVNISINSIGAHDTADQNDERMIQKDDVIKIDIGVHVDGYVGDTACTIAWDEKHQPLIQASEKALERAMELCKPGTNLGNIGAVIEKTIRDAGFMPVVNLTGHGLEQFNIHAQPQIPNVKTKTDYCLQENQVIAIEPFATTGEGAIKESEPTLIYSMVRERQTRNMDARKIMRLMKERNGLPFTVRWIPMSGFKLRLALKELADKKVLYDYPVLREVSNGLISQTEHTIIVKERPIVTTL